MNWFIEETEKADEDFSRGKIDAVANSGNVLLITRRHVDIE